MPPPFQIGGAALFVVGSWSRLSTIYHPVDGSAFRDDDSKSMDDATTMCHETKSVVDHVRIRSKTIVA